MALPAKSARPGRNWPRDTAHRTQAAAAHQLPAEHRNEPRGSRSPLPQPSPQTRSMSLDSLQPGARPWEAERHRCEHGPSGHSDGPASHRVHDEIQLMFAQRERPMSGVHGTEQTSNQSRARLWRRPFRFADARLPQGCCTRFRSPHRGENRHSQAPSMLPDPLP